jgi:hypothetical protein
MLRGQAPAYQLGVDLVIDAEGRFRFLTSKERAPLDHRPIDGRRTQLIFPTASTSTLNKRACVCRSAEARS